MDSLDGETYEEINNSVIETESLKSYGSLNNNYMKQVTNTLSKEGANDMSPVKLNPIPRVKPRSVVTGKPQLRTCKPLGKVGFSSLPEQVYRRSIRKGFEFSLMVVGESGLGKSTLVNSMFLTDIYTSQASLQLSKAFDCKP